MTEMARREVTLREWWELRREAWAEGSEPVEYGTVQQWPKMNRLDWPKPCRVIGKSHLYYLTDLDAWKKRHPLAGRGR